MILEKEQNLEMINIINNIQLHENKYKLILKNNIEIKNFISNLNNYCLIIKILSDFPDFYEDLKYIETNNELERTIWNFEHYNYIENIREIEPIIKKIIKDGLKLEYITNIQYKILKLINSKIKNVFKSDLVLNTIYNKNNKLITKKEIEFFCNIIHIIFYRMLEKSNKKNKLKNEELILFINNDDYFNYFINLKKLLETKLFIKSNNFIDQSFF